MSESEHNGQRRAASANRRRATLAIRLEDHIGDPVGLAFLEEPEHEGDLILARLGAYLGPRMKILKAEISRGRIEVDVEARGWPEEGARLAGAAADLLRKGAPKAAIGLASEALALDPLSADALATLGRAQVARGQHAEALDALRRAREIGGEQLEVLLALAQATSALERMASATAYLQAAVAIDPQCFVARRALAQLGFEAAPREPDASRPTRIRQ